MFAVVFAGFPFFFGSVGFAVRNRGRLSGAGESCGATVALVGVALLAALVPKQVVFEANVAILTGLKFVRIAAFSLVAAGLDAKGAASKRFAAEALWAAAWLAWTTGTQASIMAKVWEGVAPKPRGTLVVVDVASFLILTGVARVTNSG